MSDQAPDSFPSQNTEAALIEQVREAVSHAQPLRISGTESKDFYGNATRAPGGTEPATLDCTGHCGLIAYDPSELTITVRAGTPLAEVEARLAAHEQQLPFEPPYFGPQRDGGTIGGMVAAGLSGPQRPYAGSLRDALLGVRLLNGQGEVLNLGGQVMKNVAGYDLSRLMAGALGVLGVLLEVSLKVIPVPPGRLTLVHDAPVANALARLRRWARRPLPVSATACLDGRLYVRLSGSEEALAESHRLIGGLPLPEADGFWRDLRDQRLPFFAGEAPLWRLSVSPATPAAALCGATRDGTGNRATLIEWGGAQRWLRGEQDANALRAAARAAGGHATLFRAGSAQPPLDGIFTPLAPVALRLHRNLKQAFDPQGIFNPGRLYPERSAQTESHPHAKRA